MEKYHENGNKLAHVLLQTATLFMLPPLDNSQVDIYNRKLLQNLQKIYNNTNKDISIHNYSR